MCSDYKMIIQYWTAEGKSKKRKTVWDRSTYIGTLQQKKSSPK